MEFELARNTIPFVIAGTCLPLLIMLWCACSCGSDADRYDNTNERNAKLAALLALMLVAEPNQKYLEIAKDIGIDHIVPDERVFHGVESINDTLLDDASDD